MRSGSSTDKGRDKGTLSLIWVTIGVANTAGIAASFILHQFQISESIIIPFSGLLVIVIGMILRFYSIYSLGHFFTVDVAILKDHKLKTGGIYRYLRHPSYSGMLLSFVGFGLSLNNWISLVVINVAVTIATLSRVKTEEKALAEQFGEEYASYVKRSYRMIPWVY